ncbi:MAG: valine--tRNA ligase, partial [Actinobacteria bacterium]|nr:valine--tRNA ligase [Actinomycetota bacterium]
AIIALRKALLTMLRLLAPFLPFATDEVWSWWQSGESIHRSSWPKAEELSAGLDSSYLELLPLAEQSLFGIRKAKSDAKASMKADVELAVLVVPAASKSKLELLTADLSAAGRIAKLELVAGDELLVKEVVLTPAAE